MMMLMIEASSKPKALQENIDVTLEFINCRIASMFHLNASKRLNCQSLKNFYSQQAAQNFKDFNLILF